jgi:hypothetical protein
MSFAEEFKNLDPARLEQAYANVSERLLIISKVSKELAEQEADIFNEIRTASPGFMAIIGRFEETAQMLDAHPGEEHGKAWFNMVQMNLGAISLGLVLAEYARLEQEELE